MFTAAPPVVPTLAERLGLILAGLRRDLAAGAAKDRALAVLVLVLWNRLSRTLARFTAATGRFRGRAVPTPVRRKSVAASPPRDPLPRERGWLVRRLQGCAVYGEHLRLLIADPEMEALLATAPSVRRLIRPLWRMLRTDTPPEALRPPPKIPSRTAPEAPAGTAAEAPAASPPRYIGRTRRASHASPRAGLNVVLRPGNRLLNPT